MTVLRALPDGAAAAPAAEGLFEVCYVGEDGGLCRVALAPAWRVRLELAAPCRKFASYKGRRNYPGRWWCATTGGHVGYESWLERPPDAAGLRP